MKLIEAMKKVKDLQRKATDLREKIGLYCADYDTDTPTYKNEADQRAILAGWLQAHHDLIKEIERLRLDIQATNLATLVTIEIAEKQSVTKCIAGWIHRRKELADLEKQAWSRLTNRGLKDTPYRADAKDPNSAVQVAHVRRYYDQKERDVMVEEYTSEPSRINGALEVANAQTELVAAQTSEN